jgi:hypothetical protein
MSDCDNNYRPALLIEYHAPIADPKPPSSAAFEALHIAFSVCRKLRQTSINTLANLHRELDPLIGRSSRP